MNPLYIIAFPFIGTFLGSCGVFFLKNELKPNVQKLFLGFASGVMIAASVWSLIIPAMNQSASMGKLAFIPCTVGIILGILFLLVLDKIIPHLHLNADEPEGVSSKLKKTTMLVLAVTLHNIPEGMAVGVAFAGALAGNTGMTIAGAISLAIGIAIQNIPEGAIISMPIKNIGIGKCKAFFYGLISGVVEPIASFITLLLISKINIILPYLLAFAAGAMIYVVTDELIPQTKEYNSSKIGIIGLTIGFLIMMILDVSLG